MTSLMFLLLVGIIIPCSSGKPKTTTTTTATTTRTTTTTTTITTITCPNQVTSSPLTTLTTPVLNTELTPSPSSSPSPSPAPTTKLTTTTQAPPPTTTPLRYTLNITQTSASFCPVRYTYALFFNISNAVDPVDCSHFTNNLATPPCLTYSAYTAYQVPGKNVYSACDWNNGYYTFTMTCYDAVGAMGKLDFGWNCTATDGRTTFNPYYWGL